MNSEWISYLVWADIAIEKGGVLTPSYYPGMVGLTAEETCGYVMQAAGITLNLVETVDRVWKIVTERIGTGIDPQPGASDLLCELNRREIPMAIASNSPSDYINQALHGLKFSPFFQETVGVDQVKNGKPAPDVYLQAAERLGVDPIHCLAIEDSLVGSQSALSAGMRVLAVPAPEDDRGKFSACFGIYDSLVQVKNELDFVLSHP